MIKEDEDLERNSPQTKKLSMMLIETREKNLGLRSRNEILPVPKSSRRNKTVSFNDHSRIQEISIMKSKTEKLSKETTVSEHSNTFTNSDFTDKRLSYLFFEKLTGRELSHNEYYGFEEEKTKKGDIYTARELIEPLERIKLKDRIIKYPSFIIPIKSRLKFRWDISMVFIVLINSVLNPLEISFNEKETEINYIFKNVDNVVLCIYVIDLFLSCRTTYFDEQGNEILNAKKISVRYLKSPNFILDFVSSLPFTQVLSAFVEKSHSRYVKFVNLLKIVRLLRITRLLAYIKAENLKIVYKISRQLIILILLIHWINCLWYFLLLQTYDGEDSNDQYTWLPSNIRFIQDPDKLTVPNTKALLSESFYDESTFYARYLYSIYSLVLMIFGNEIAPATAPQAMFAIVCCILGSFFIALVLGETNILISKLSYKKSLYVSKYDELQNKIFQNKLPDTMRIKIMDYFEYSWQKQEGHLKIEDFSKLSEPIQKELLFFINKDLVLQVPLFKYLEPDEILEIIKKLRSQYFLPSDLILKEGELGNEMFFLTEGLVEIKLKSAESLLLKPGSYFGEISLITNSKRTSDVKAVDFSVTLTYSREDYLSLGREFPGIKERLLRGLSDYKLTNLEGTLTILMKNQFFKNFSQEQIKLLVMKYLKDLFVEEKKLVLKPKKKVNAVYFLIMGRVKVYNNSEMSRYLLEHMITKKSSPEKEVKKEPLENITRNTPEDLSIDEEMENFPNVFKEELSNLVTEVNNLWPGDIMGGLNPSGVEVACDSYYYCEYTSHLLYLDKSTLDDLKTQEPSLHKVVSKSLETIGNIGFRSKKKEETVFSNMSNRGSYKEKINFASSQIKKSNLTYFNDGMLVVEDSLQGSTNSLNEIKEEVNLVHPSKKKYLDLKNLGVSQLEKLREFEKKTEK